MLSRAPPLIVLLGFLCVRKRRKEQNVFSKSCSRLTLEIMTYLLLLIYLFIYLLKVTAVTSFLNSKSLPITNLPFLLNSPLTQEKCLWEFESLCNSKFSFWTSRSDCQEALILVRISDSSWTPKKHSNHHKLWNYNAYTRDRKSVV